jgi:hypothetical protein
LLVVGKLILINPLIALLYYISIYFWGSGSVGGVVGEKCSRVWCCCLQSQC